MIIKAKTLGFCGGVMNAVKNVYSLEKFIHDGAKVYLLGEIVNNGNVIRDLQAKGFILIHDPAEASVPGRAIAVIRAHGAGRDVYRALQQKQVQIKDYTCKNVIRTQKIVSEMSAKGYAVLIVGKKKHPEVIGITGWCDGSGDHPGRHPVYVIENETDLAGCGDHKKICVVAQTTFNSAKWKNLLEAIRHRYADAEIHAVNTLCKATEERQSAALEMTAAADLVIVLGDPKSSNSNELFAACREACEDSYFINSLDDLIRNRALLQKIHEANVIGLTASASMPDQVIDSVYHYLQFVDYLSRAKMEMEQGFAAFFGDKDSAADPAPVNTMVNTMMNTIVWEAREDLRRQNEGGKRIRGALIKLGKEIAAGSCGLEYLPIAAGYEIFQTSILIHDDVIDNSEKRRDKMTIHADTALRLQKELQKNRAKETAGACDHFGVSRAICIGDYGFFLSFLLLSQAALSPEILQRVYQMYSEILIKTCEGEMLDVSLPYQTKNGFNDFEAYKAVIYSLYEYKTAWYTIAGPLCLGAAIAGVDESMQSALRDIGLPLGVAFQIKDDLLGIYADEKTVGKSVLSDIQEKKQTILYAYALHQANDQQKIMLNNAYGKTAATMEDLYSVRQIFHETGARKYAEEEAARLSDEAVQAIRRQNFPQDSESLLLGLVHYLTHRES
ncbi:MAG: 4-hydroxy-3-methylbut-2-enyl diphosphate reductase [Clostridiales bacterium]|jgi:4-hydroxy-3-methylbut-2-enyl diphosphate reductase|nr:4-hydroxy-3-methylbut-2-enyl diphosphate reductase [Clostridiales bacterium]